MGRRREEGESKAGEGKEEEGEGGGKKGREGGQGQEGRGRERKNIPLLISLTLIYGRVTLPAPVDLKCDHMTCFDQQK